MRDIPKLSGTEMLILQLLVAAPKGLYGLELVRSSAGKIKRGTVYVLLMRLEDKGFVTSKDKAPPANVGGPPRPVYRVTGAGQRVLAAYEVLRGALEGA
jgi:DNA-binding PadR family transcriptional regulator